MRTALVFCALIPLATFAAVSEDELRQAEKAWATAVTKKDYAALERILHDELIYAHSTGVIETKTQYVNRLRTGAQKYDSIEHEKITVKLHGDAAVTHSIVRMKGLSDKRPFDDRLMMIHLWVKRGGQWRLAAHQTTKLP